MSRLTWNCWADLEGEMYMRREIVARDDTRACIGPDMSRVYILVLVDDLLCKMRLDGRAR